MTGKTIKKTLLGILILGLVYTVAMETFLINDFNYFKDAPITLHIFPDGGVGTMPSGFSFSRDYLFERPIMSPFYQIGKLIHIKKEYYLCFEGYTTPLVLSESNGEEWFGSSGYHYKPIEKLNLAEEKYEYQEGFYDNFPTDKNITRAKLTSKQDCSNYEKINQIFEYTVKITRGSEF